MIDLLPPTTLFTAIQRGNATKLGPIDELEWIERTVLMWRWKATLKQRTLTGSQDGQRQ